MQMDDYALIKLVEKHDFLYSKLSPKYKNRALKLETWRKLSRLLNEPADDLLKRWLMLRNRYTAEKRKHHNKLSECTWQYFPILSFLDPHIFPRRTKSTIALRSGADDTTNHPINYDENSGCSLILENDYVDSIESGISPVFTTTRRLVKISSFSNRPPSHINKDTQEDNSYSEKETLPDDDGYIEENLPKRIKFEGVFKEELHEDVLLAKDPLATVEKKVNDPLATVVSSQAERKAENTKHMKDRLTIVVDNHVKKKTENVRHMLDPLAAIVSNRIDKNLEDSTKTMSNTQDDEEMMFAKSIALALKRIKSRKRRFQAKIKLLEVFVEFEDDE